MPVLIQMKNVPPKATICQIFLLFSEMEYEPEEITLLERRLDSVFFELQRLDLAYRAVQLSGRMMLSHSVVIAHSAIKDLIKFRDGHKNVPVDNSCYVALPSPPLCPPSFSGDIRFMDYNERILKMLGSDVSRKEPFSVNREAGGIFTANGRSLRESGHEQTPDNPPSGSFRQNNGAVSVPAVIYDPLRAKNQSIGKKADGNGVGKRKKPETFFMREFEPPQHRHKTGPPELVTTNDMGRPATDQIQLECNVSATKCFLRWRLSLKLRVHCQELEVETNYTEVSRVRLGLVNEFVLITVPGSFYSVELFALDALGNVLAVGQCSFKATFSMDEMHTLYQMALKFAGDMLHPYKNLYRCKPKRYYDSIYNVEGRIMKPYLKDNNGQAACPINGVLHGLFFSARLKDNGQLPHSSPFGEVRMQIPVEKLLNGDKVNMYFSDFYCNYQLHYVTLVICKKGSDSDRFCRDRLILLSPRNNNFLKVVDGQNGRSFCVNLKVWVEIYYTEEISLYEAAKFDQIETIGRGYSKEDGLPHNKSCLECNLYPRCDV